MATSLKDYLKKYQSTGDGDKQPKKSKKKRKVAAKVPAGLIIVDNDAAWQKNIDEDSDEPEVEGDGPQVLEDVEVKRMHQMERVKQHRPYMSIGDDGSGWSTVDRKSKDAQQTSVTLRAGSPGASPSRRDPPSPSQDISPPRRRNASDLSLSGRGKSPDISPRRRRNASDLSPSRRGKSPDISPRRRRNASDLSLSRRGKSADISPPRRRNASDLSLSRRGKSPDISPPRRRYAPDISPPRRRNAPDISPPRRRNAPDAFPSGRIPPEDTSPPRKRKPQTDSLDMSPPRRKSSRADPIDRKMTDGRQAGLITDKEERAAELLKKKQEDARRLRDMDGGGRAAETVYRDKHGKRLEGLEELLRQQQGEVKPEAKPLEWGKGLAQKREVEEQRAEFEAEKAKPFARTRDDPELDKLYKERVRWGDPMAHLVKRKDPAAEVPDLGASEEMKESGFIIPQGISKHSWLIRGVGAPMNRYGIKPGRHWDGVNRSTGFESQMFKAKTEKQATEMEAYLWSVSDM